MGWRFALQWVFSFNQPPVSTRSSLYLYKIEISGLGLRSLSFSDSANALQSMPRRHFGMDPQKTSGSLLILRSLIDDIKWWYRISLPRLSLTSGFQTSFGILISRIFHVRFTFLGTVLIAIQ